MKRVLVIVALVALVVLSVPAFAQSADPADPPNARGAGAYQGGEAPVCERLELCPAPVVVNGEAYAGNGLLWQTNFLDDELVLIDTDDVCNVVQTCPTPGGAAPSENAHDGTFLYHYDFNTGQLYQIDTLTCDVVSQCDPPGNNFAEGLAWDGQFLWKGDSNFLYQFTPPPACEIVSFCPNPIGDSADGLAFCSDYLIMLGYSGRFFQIDTNACQVVSSCFLQDGPLGNGLASDGIDSIFVDQPGLLDRVDLICGQPFDDLPQAVCNQGVVYDGVGDECCATVAVADLDGGSFDPNGPGDIASICITGVDGAPVPCLQEIEVCGAAPHTLELSITDMAGNSDTCDSQIFIQCGDPNDPPVAVCNPSVVGQGDGPECCSDVAVTDIDAGSFDPDGHPDIADICITAVDGNPVPCQQTVQICGEDPVTIELTITDLAGESDSCTTEYQNKCPGAGEPPVAICNGSIELPGQGAACCSPVTVDDVDNGSFDADGAADIDTLCITAVDGNPVGCVQEIEVCGDGLHSVELTITDMAGGSDSCTSAVDVQCPDPPIAVCNQGVDADGFGSECCAPILVADVDGGSSDPDGPMDIDTICITAVDGDPVPCEQSVAVCGEGRHILELTVTDQSGASDTCEPSVIVECVPDVPASRPEGLLLLFALGLIAINAARNRRLRGGAGG